MANIKGYLDQLDPSSPEYHQAKETITGILEEKRLNIPMEHFDPPKVVAARSKRFKKQRAAKEKFEDALTQLEQIAKFESKNVGSSESLKITEEQKKILSQLKNDIEGYVKRFDQGTPEHSAARTKVNEKLLEISNKGVYIQYERIGLPDDNS